MPFALLDEHLPRLQTLATGDAPLPPLPAAPIGSFGDDLAVGRDRVRVRVVAKGRDRRVSLDFRDSDGIDAARGFGLDADDLRLACVLAVSEALGTRADRRWLEQLDVQHDSRSWVGGAPASDPGRRAFSLARVFDAILGALAASWPARVGAGSCTVGALVELAADEERLCEAIPGGEGATPSRNGRPGWNSPVLGMVSTAAFMPWLSITQRSRVRSGGGGARVGGDGVERTYSVARNVTAIVGIDRVSNPPHGIDRAGPPRPSIAVTVDGSGATEVVEPWTPFTLPAGSTLRIETAGGAGHGFGGYGDIEFDPSDWFGSKED